MGCSQQRNDHAKRDTTLLQELLRLKEPLEANTFKPVIDRVYTREQIVVAHRYVDQGHKKGNVVLTVSMLKRPNHWLASMLLRSAQ
jgi:NADPH:quinone reductase-like Zn-dependent oxidoreductase